MELIVTFLLVMWALVFLTGGSKAAAGCFPAILLILGFFWLATTFG